MKFNEKLIELRKKEGLSQEELGYKLNVTRQTVSKWELGQTTPEMEKLTEISKIFNVSVDELINEAETTTNQNTVIEDQPIGMESKREKSIKNIIIAAIIIVAILIIGSMFTAGNIFKQFFNMFDNAFDKVTGSQENIVNEAGSIFDKAFDVFDQVTESQENTTSEFEVEEFNISFEIYAGSNKGTFVISVLDNIITSNKTEDRKITVKYMETETQSEDEIKNIKYNIEKFDDYEISFEYDADGFINEVTIEKL